MSKWLLNFLNFDPIVFTKIQKKHFHYLIQKEYCYGTGRHTPANTYSGIREEAQTKEQGTRSTTTVKCNEEKTKNFNDPLKSGKEYFSALAVHDKILTLEYFVRESLIYKGLAMQQQLHVVGEVSSSVVVVVVVLKSSSSDISSL